MDEPKLNTTAEERNRCVNSVCPSVITVRKMADDIETLLAERDVLRNDVAHLEMDRDIARSERETLSEALDQEAEHRIAMERSYREQIKITEQQLTDSNAEREQLLKNRDQWERNSAAENKRAGDLEVEVRTLKSERDALAEKLKAREGLINLHKYINGCDECGIGEVNAYCAEHLAAHDAEIRKKALEEAVNVCKQQGSSFAAWGIRSLIDAPKEGK